MRALVFQNPTSGDGELGAEALCACVEAAGYEPVYFSTKQDDYRKALNEPADVVVVAGGDGTVGKVLRNRDDRVTPIAIVAAGTANNIAQTLGITGTPQAYLAGIAGARSVPLDVGIATGPWGHGRFLEGVGFGALAHSMDRGEDAVDGHGLSRKEKIRAGRHLLRQAIALDKAVASRIEIDGRAVSGEFVFIEVLNIGSTGPDLTLSPAAKSGDGLLDIVMLPAARRVEMVAWFDADDDAAPMPVTCERGRSVSVSCQSGAIRRDDGIWPKPVQPSIIRIGLEDEPFQVLVPGGPRGSKQD